MKNGSRITLGGSSRDKFIYWWRKNVEAEKIELPDPPASEVVVEAEAQTPVAPAAGPAPVVPALPPVPVVTNPVPPILTSPPEEKVSDDKK